MTETYAADRAALIQLLSSQLTHAGPSTLAAMFNALFRGAARAYPIPEDDLYLLRAIQQSDRGQVRAETRAGSATWPGRNPARFRGLSGE